MYFKVCYSTALQRCTSTHGKLQTALAARQVLLEGPACNTCLVHLRHSARSFAACQPAQHNGMRCHLSCSRWPGVLCSATAQQLELLLSQDASSSSFSNTEQRDVVGLFLTAAGLSGTLPPVFSQLPNLRVVLLGHNPRLSGTWPASVYLEHLRHLEVQVGSWPGLRSHACILQAESAATNTFMPTHALTAPLASVPSC